MTFQRVPQETHGPLMQCYQTVERMVAEHGGESQFGWQILWWPNLYVEALHHAVWRKPDGTLLDVTEKYPTDTKQFTTFALDDSIIPRTDRPAGIQTKFAMLNHSKEVRDFVNLSHAQVERTRILYDGMEAAGIKFTFGEQVAVPDHLYHHWVEHDKDRDRLSAAFVALSKLGRSKKGR